MIQPTSPGNRAQLSDGAATHVRNQIMSGRLLPGDSVRPEAVGDALGISTTPARESLQALRVEEQRLVDERLPRRAERRPKASQQKSLL